MAHRTTQVNLDAGMQESWSLNRGIGCVHHHHINAERSAVGSQVQHADDGIAHVVQQRQGHIVSHHLALGLLGGEDIAGIGPVGGMEQRQAEITDAVVSRLELHAEVLDLMVERFHHDAALRGDDVAEPARLTGKGCAVGGQETQATAAGRPGGLHHHLSIALQQFFHLLGFAALKRLTNGALQSQAGQQLGGCTTMRQLPDQFQILVRRQQTVGDALATQDSPQGQIPAPRFYARYRHFGSQALATCKLDCFTLQTGCLHATGDTPAEAVVGFLCRFLVFHPDNIPVLCP